MEDSERRKVVELLKEMRNESSSKDTNQEKEEIRLNWMYKGPSDFVDKEEYLLGKTIDKSFEVLNNASNSDACLGRTFEQSNVPKRLLEKTESTEQVDIAKKILEDPLYAIKQKEMEARKKLLNNPVKLKQIKQMLLERNKNSSIPNKQKKKKLKKRKLDSQKLDLLIIKLLKKFSDKEKQKALNKIMQSDSDCSSTESSSSSNEKTKKKKKNKKLKKKITSSSSSDSSSERSNSFEENKLKRQKKDSRLKKNSSISNSNASQYKKNKVSKSKKKSSKSSYKHARMPSTTSSSSSSDSESISDSEEEKRKNFRHKSPKRSKIFNFENDKSLDNRKKKEKIVDETEIKEKDKIRNIRNKNEESENSSDEDKKLKRNYGLMVPDGFKPPTKRSSPVRKYEKKAETQSKYLPPLKQKPLSEKEREEKLKEMMENAKLRKEDRERNLAHHRKKESKAEAAITYDDDFMRRQMSNLTSKGSMADRIKSNINNIQRSKSSMDSSFMRK